NACMPIGIFFIAVMLCFAMQRCNFYLELPNLSIIFGVKVKHHNQPNNKKISKKSLILKKDTYICPKNNMFN
ncbi:MAG: hypothetical protein IKB95_05595, partial [Bacteroidales bacterium]|nr:hypothetical protein [Bacteroidales bacterium]